MMLRDIGNLYKSRDSEDNVRVAKTVARGNEDAMEIRIGPVALAANPLFCPTVATADNDTVAGYLHVLYTTLVETLSSLFPLAPNILVS